MAIDITRSMIDPQLNQQFKTVFEKFDRDKQQELTWPQFQEFCYAIGLQFLIQEYENDLKDTIFGGNFNGSRASFESFKEFIDMKSRFEEGPDAYEKDMEIFDEDHNGTAPIKDVIRVMKELAHMQDDEVSLFIKKCCFENLTEEQMKQPLESMQLPESFSISKSTARLFNV